MRLLAIITNGGEATKVKHYVGLPPELTGGKDARQELGRARFLVIEEDLDGVFLYRYGAQGQFVGDTWHKNVDDAKNQASYEYGESVKDWAAVPPEVEDVVVFGLNGLGSAQ